MNKKKFAAFLAAVVVLSIGGYFLFAGSNVDSGDLQGKFTYTSNYKKSKNFSNYNKYKESAKDLSVSKPVELPVDEAEEETDSKPVDLPVEVVEDTRHDCTWGDTWTRIFSVNDSTRYFDEENRGYAVLLDAVNSGCDFKVVVETRDDNYNRSFECDIVAAGTTARGQRTFSCDSATRVSGNTTHQITGEDIQEHLVSTEFEFVWDASGSVRTEYLESLFIGDGTGYRDDMSGLKYFVFARS